MLNIKKKKKKLTKKLKLHRMQAEKTKMDAI